MLYYVQERTNPELSYKELAKGSGLWSTSPFHRRTSLNVMLNMEQSPGSSQRGSMRTSWYMLGTRRGITSVISIMSKMQDRCGITEGVSTAMNYRQLLLYICYYTTDDPYQPSISTRSSPHPPSAAKNPRATAEPYSYQTD